MKKQKTQKDGNGETSQSVRIEFKHPTAAAVAIAGSFNDWRPEATQMIRLANGRWLKELTLAPGIYEYRLVVDGAWMPDPSAVAVVSNPFGELNSVLKVNPATAGQAGEGPRRKRRTL